MNFATKRDYLDLADPMRGIENPKLYRHAPVIAANDGELVALFNALDAPKRMWPATKLAIEFQIITGAKPVEARLATWSEVNLDRALLIIPPDRVKTGREFRVHLSGPAIEVLKRVLTLKGEKSDFVFPGAKGKAMEKMAVARALARLAARDTGEDAKKLRPHDLRRTFRTMLSRIGVAPHIAELCMNHLEAETMRRVYDGHDYSGEMADAWRRAGTHVAALRLSAGTTIAPAPTGAAVNARRQRAGPGSKQS